MTQTPKELPIKRPLRTRLTYRLLHFAEVGSLALLVGLGLMLLFPQPNPCSGVQELLLKLSFLPLCAFFLILALLFNGLKMRVVFGISAQRGTPARRGTPTRRRWLVALLPVCLALTLGGRVLHERYRASHGCDLGVLAERAETIHTPEHPASVDKNGFVHLAPQDSRYSGQEEGDIDLQIGK